jgi:hypothetical protein
MTNDSGKENFMWGKEQHRAFDDPKHRFFSAPVLSSPDMQQPFNNETNAFEYVVGTFLTQHGHSVAYHSETLLYIVQKYPTYDKEMYSIVKSCCQWKYYILGKETIIHTDHKPMKFIQTQGELQNNHHQKWSTYLQQFHLKIKYKTRSTNRVVDCLRRPLVVALTTVLHSYGNEAFEWPQLYQQDPDFATTYKLLGTGTIVTNFHIQDGLLCNMGHLFVPASKRANMIWESHYSQVVGHFGMEKTMAIL